MKQNLLKKFKLRVLMLVAVILCGAGSAWGGSVTWQGTTALPGTFTAIGESPIQIMASSTNTYTNPIRVYANTTITIQADEGFVINSVTYEASSTGNYVTYAQNATVNPNVTPTVSDKNVTWTFGPDVTTFTFMPSTQTRCNSITITYTSTGGGSTAVATTTTIDDSGITNTDVYTSTTAGSLAATVTAGADAIAGATVTWSGDNDDVATINATTGAVTLVAAGTVIFTATYAGVSGQYEASSSTYEMTVTSNAPYVQPTTVEITPNYTFWGKEGQFSGSTYSELSGSQDNVTLSWTRGSGSTYANTTAMRFYKDNTLTFTAPAGYEIKSIQLTISGTYSDLSFAPTGYDNETTTWTGSSETVTMSRPSNASSYATISKFTITIGLPSTDPSISVSDVNIDYDATSGNIDYTLSNPVTGTALTAAVTDGSWLTLGTISETSIPFTCSANEDQTARTATVTLTYGSLTKTVTVTQAAAPLVYTTIPALFAAATSTSTPVTVTFGNWVVTGVNYNQVFVTDGTNGFIMYEKEHGFEVGNTLSGTVSCNLVLFNGSAEITGLTSGTEGLTVEENGSVSPVTTTIDALNAVNTGSVVTLSNLTYNGTVLSDGTNEIVYYTTLHNETPLENGKTYNITGVFVLNNDTKRILPRSENDIEEVSSVTPITGDQYQLFTGDLVEGDYIIYYDGKAMNTTVTSDRLQYEEVTPINDVITTDNAAIVWHIAPSGDYWTIYNAAADAYAASTGARNKAQMLADGTDDKALWTVSGTETYEFVNKANAASEVNANLRNNGTYGFACYATGTGGALSLYKKVEATPEPEAYAVVSTDEANVTFYYDALKATREGTKYDITDGGTHEWSNTTNYPNYKTTLKTATFDSSFENYESLNYLTDWFIECQALESITGLEYLNTSNVTDMARLFRYCQKLTSLDLSSFNTAKVQNMTEMFGFCTGLTSITLGANFNTANVYYMQSMFNNCMKLTTIDVSGFNTEKVTSMNGMFWNCDALTVIDLSSFNTANVANMGSMFGDCGKLVTIYVGDGWNTDKVALTSSASMFEATTKIVGGNGTKYNYNYTTKTYGRIDGNGGVGYLSHKTKKYVTIGDTGYTTFVPTANVSLSDGVEAYGVDEIKDNSMHLLPIESAVPANEAVVLKAAAGVYALPIAESATAVSGNLLQASDGNVVGGENIYVLANKTKGVGFYPTASTIKVPAGKAYLNTSSSPVKNFLAFDFSGADGINAIDNGQLTVDSSVIYNIAGQRMNKLQRGVNIVNGKKVLVK